MEKTSILGEAIFAVRDFLSLEECEAFIAASEEQGYEEAPINTRDGPRLRSPAGS